MSNTSKTSSQSGDDNENHNAVLGEETESTSSPINISVTFRHTDPTDALKNYAHEKVNHCLEKYKLLDADVHVILSVEKRDNSAEARVSSKRFDLSAKASTEDLYSSIDKVCDNLAAQIRKQKEKTVGHR